MWVDLSEGVGFMGSGWSDLWGRGIEVLMPLKKIKFKESCTLKN